MKFVIAIMLLFPLSSLAGVYPDLKFTPGKVDPEATIQKICKAGYTALVRHVPESEKKAVCARYHFECRPGKQEIDHLISLELGGSNEIENLWPEPYLPRPGAREKDQVEDELHREVCKGKLALSAAQHIVVTDWLAFYREMEK